MPISPTYNASGSGAARGWWAADPTDPSKKAYFYPDGTMASNAEINAARQARGLGPIEDITWHGTSFDNGGDPRASADPFETGDTTSPNSGQEAVTKGIGAGAPGATLDTTGADQERETLRPLLARLQQQATTGGGAWEGTLADNTAKASADVQSLGQAHANRGGGYASSLRDIGNAQAGVNQRAAGQANILRNESKQAATGQLSSLLAGQGAQDIAQASDSADVNFGRRSANAQIKQSNDQAAVVDKKNDEDTALKVISSIPGLSDGGAVPGKPQVFGDNQQNDTVPAMLSPGELVIPRSHAGSPEAAADFVRALQRNGGAVRHMAEGGTTGGVEDPSIANGALLDDGAYYQTQARARANQGIIEQTSLGAGPSTAPQQFQNGRDSNFAAALQAQAHGRGPAAGDVLQMTGAATQGAAGDAARGVAGEQQAGQAALAQSGLTRRDQEMAMAKANQGAAWRNTLLNSGISIENANALASLQNQNHTRALGVAGGFGQGLAAYSAAAGANRPTNDDFAKGGPADLHGYDDEGPPRPPLSDPSEWSNPYAMGGEVEDKRGEEFVAALRRQGYR